MISPPVSNARRRLRRPLRATLLALAVLCAFATALVAPSAGLAQEVDPLAAVEQAIDGGVAVPAEVETSLEETVEAGGAPVVAEALLEPEPAPAPSPDPLPEPEADVPPVPDTGMLSETAPAPAPESQPSDVTEEADLAAPVAPVNLNVDIRILSPGDNGDVTQEIGVPGWSGQDGRATDSMPLDWEWNWNWTWNCESGPTAAGMAWNWNWDWDCAVPEVPPDGVIPDGVMEAPGLLFAEAPMDQVAGMLPVDIESLTSTDRAPPARRDAGATGRSGHDPPTGPPGLAEPQSLLIVAGSTGGAASVAPAAARATQGRRQPNRGHAPAPEQAPTVLPSAAASSFSGGSSAPLAAALLGLLCLLAPHALEPARSRYRKLSSLLSSGRLERPG
jgi:hypothetical protein